MPDPVPEEESRLPGMSLLEHLEELRKRIIYALISVAVAFFLCWGYAEDIFRLMERPIMEALRANHLAEKLVYTSPTDPFNIYLKIGLIAGLFVASPAVLYQVWAFIAPGLYRDEKKYILPFLVATVGLFVSGGWFGYRIVYPAALTFLIDYGKDFQPMITVGEYTDLFLTVILGLGLVFELPTIVFFLALMGVVDAGFLWRNMRYAIFGIFVVAAVLTPTTDIVNMSIFAAPMIVLYVLSIGVAWLVHPKRRRRAAEAAGS
ncbi:MAG: twin-arginine translocase subunit TatC [Acidobacteriales bacterium]|nr:twin-arginine translocase subunit TatC [Terriglobales bacterium]